MRRIPRHINPATAIAVIALVFALSGTAIAARRYLITNPKQISPVVIKQLAKLAGRQAAQGPTGQNGSNGLSGERGPAGPGAEVHWAVVDGNATLARPLGKGVSVERVGEADGTYVVTFDRDVTECGYEATIGRSGTESVEDPGFATVVRRFEVPNGVLVQTYDTAGTRVDKDFDLAVFC
jgi:hypothetical protein